MQLRSIKAQLGYRRRQILSFPLRERIRKNPKCSLGHKLDLDLEYEVTRLYLSKLCCLLVVSIMDRHRRSQSLVPIRHSIHHHSLRRCNSPQHLSRS